MAVAGCIVWPMRQKMITMEKDRKVQEMAKIAAMTSARGEGDDYRGRKKRGHTIIEKMPNKADAKSSGWKGWFWAQPNA